MERINIEYAINKVYKLSSSNQCIKIKTSNLSNQGNNKEIKWSNELKWYVLYIKLFKV